MSRGRRPAVAPGPGPGHDDLWAQIDARIEAWLRTTAPFTATVAASDGAGVRVIDDDAGAPNALPSARAMGARYRPGDRVVGIRTPGGEPILLGRIGEGTGAVEKTVGEPDLHDGAAGSRVIAERGVLGRHVGVDQIDTEHVRQNAIKPGNIDADYATNARVGNVEGAANDARRRADGAQNEASEARRRADAAQGSADGARDRADVAFAKGQDGVDDAKTADGKATAAQRDVAEVRGDLAGTNRAIVDVARTANEALTIAKRAFARASN